MHLLKRQHVHVYNNIGARSRHDSNGGLHNADLDTVKRLYSAKQQALMNIHNIHSNVMDAWCNVHN